MDLRKVLKAQFGYDIPFSGGVGTEDDPFLMDNTADGVPCDIVANCHLLAKLLLTLMGNKDIRFVGNQLAVKDGKRIDALKFDYLKPPYGEDDLFTKRFFFELP